MDANNTNGFTQNLYAITTKTIRRLRHFFKTFFFIIIGENLIKSYVVNYSFNKFLFQIFRGK
jgi:hypothetical protein